MEERVHERERTGRGEGRGRRQLAVRKERTWRK